MSKSVKSNQAKTVNFILAFTEDSIIGLTVKNKLEVYLKLLVEMNMELEKM